MLALQKWFLRNSSGNRPRINSDTRNSVAMLHFALFLLGFADTGISVPVIEHFLLYTSVAPKYMRAEAGGC